MVGRRHRTHLTVREGEEEGTREEWKREVRVGEDEEE